MSAATTLRLDLRPTRIAHPERGLAGVLLGVPIGLALGWATLRQELPPSFEAPLVAVALSCLLLAGAAGLRGALRRAEASPSVELETATLLLPRRWGARRREKLPLAEIRSAQVLGCVRRRLFVVLERGPALVLPARAFVDPEAPERLVHGLRHRIAALPDGEARLRRWNRAQRWAEAGGGRLPWVTLGLGLACVSGFALELGFGALGNPERMLALGANHPRLVWQGELHRLVTANLLHGSLLHLSTNLVVILLAGSLLERMLGWRRFALVAGVSAIGGSFGSSLRAGGGYSIGISTVCLGLIGCWGVLNVRFREELPAALRVSRGLAVLAVIQFALYELAASRSDLSAHLSGLLFGAATALVTSLGVEPHRLPVRTQPWLRWATAALALVILWGLKQGLQHALLERAAG